MTKLWWAQVKAVIRLEMKKTFFARRGLWIYVLALLPLLLFTAHTVFTSRDREKSRQIARQSEKALTRQDLLAVKTGMTSEGVIALLGKPPVRFHWNDRRAIRVTSAVTGTGGSGTPVNLASEYNLNGIYTDSTSFTSDGLDGAGYVYSSNLLTANRILNGIQFNLGPANQLDAVYDTAQRIKLPAGQLAPLRVLAGDFHCPGFNQLFP